MIFNFLNLDEKTRQFMIEEVNIARDSGNLYFSKRFNERGNTRWPDLLLESISNHTEHWLAYQIESEGLMSGFESFRTPSGGYSIKHIPNTAAETLADGQFNRFYILGICRRAIDENLPQIIIYRAKERRVSVIVCKRELETPYNR